MFDKYLYHKYLYINLEILKIFSYKIEVDLKLSRRMIGYVYRSIWI